MTRRVDSSEKTLHTTSGNECKFSWDSKARRKNQRHNFIFSNSEKQIAPCVSTGRELAFECSHHRISSPDSKGRVTLQNSIKHRLWQ